MTITIAACLTVAATVAAVAVRRWARNADRRDADERARLVIEDAERIVRIAEARRRHPSNRGDQ